MAAYGTRCSAEYESQGRIVHFKSQAEMWRADTLELLWKSRQIRQWSYEPYSFAIDYRYGGQDCRCTYTPDFEVLELQGVEEIVVLEEVKCGRLEQKYATRMKRFLEQHPNIKLRLIWYGSKPRRGSQKDKQLDKIRRRLHDLQFERPR